MKISQHGAEDYSGDEKEIEIGLNLKDIEDNYSMITAEYIIMSNNNSYFDVLNISKNAPTNILLAIKHFNLEFIQDIQENISFTDFYHEFRNHFSSRT